MAVSFWAQYRAALEGVPPKAKQPKTSSLRWAIDRYRNSSVWAALSPATRRQRENIFKHVIKTAGDVPLRDIGTDAIRQGRERRAQTPHSANVFIKTMRGFYVWALEEKLVSIDPTEGIKLLRGPNDENGRKWNWIILKRAGRLARASDWPLIFCSTLDCGAAMWCESACSMCATVGSLLGLRNNASAKPANWSRSRCCSRSRRRSLRQKRVILHI
jgi:hypothetical protein